jgi:hypothetical protein
MKHMTDAHALKIIVNSKKLYCSHVQEPVVFVGLLISCIIHIKEDNTKGHIGGKMFSCSNQYSRALWSASTFCHAVLCSMYHDSVIILNALYKLCLRLQSEGAINYVRFYVRSGIELG